MDSSKEKEEDLLVHPLPANEFSQNLDLKKNFIFGRIQRTKKKLSDKETRPLFIYFISWYNITSKLCTFLYESLF